MKKRKSPIIAVTVLVICLAVVFAFNYQSGVDPKAATAGPPSNTDVNVGQARPPQDPKQISSAVQSQIGSAPPSAKPMGRQGHGPGLPPGQASIAAPKTSSNKPTPNDSSVSSQWYQPNSTKGGQ